jgi:hypothetical protein
MPSGKPGMTGTAPASGIPKETCTINSDLIQHLKLMERLFEEKGIIDAMNYLFMALFSKLFKYFFLK